MDYKGKTDSGKKKIPYDEKDRIRALVSQESAENKLEKCLKIFREDISY